MAGSPLSLETVESYAAAVFDLDGVLTDTARVHAAAWKELFDGYLRARAEGSGEPFEPFDIERDYRRYVDGKPRYEGVRSFLKSRQITLPYGEPADPPDRETVCGLGNRKNEVFTARLERDGVDVFPSSVELLRDLRKKGLKTALVSSSKNARAVLDAAGLTDLFDACVDGLEAVERHLEGKPDPAMFAYAAKVLGVAPGRAFAVEDAVAGVESAHAAGYGLVIGVDRNGLEDALREHGADVVLRDLGEIMMHERLPNAIESFEAFWDLLAEKSPAFFLDYDGTLTPIVSRPDLAVMTDGMRAVVRNLARACPVAIVSGRDRVDVEELVGLRELVYAGSHGFDIAGPDGLERQYEAAAAYLGTLDRAEARVREAVKDIDGALVERKRYAIAAHYRLVDEGEVDRVEQAVDEAIDAALGDLRKTGGKKVFEIRPELPWDKGRAVVWLLHALGLDRPDVAPVYIGDDETDEDAFTALRDRGGIGILVAPSPQRTAARYALADPSEVERFLHRLTQWLQEKGT